MPFGLIQIEQERSDLWKAEVEAGFPVCKRKMLHAVTFEDVIAQVSATFRELVPPPDDLKAAAALKEAEAHFQSAIAAIDEFLSWPTDMDKEQFMDRLRSQRQIFETRLATHDPGYGLMPVDAPDQLTELAGGIGDMRELAGEPAGEPDAPEASEAGETVTGHQAPSAEAHMQPGAFEINRIGPEMQFSEPVRRGGRPKLPRDSAGNIIRE